MISQIVNILKEHPQVSYLHIINNRTVVKFVFLGESEGLYCSEIDEERKLIKIFLDPKCELSSAYSMEQIKGNYDTEITKDGEVWRFWSLGEINK